MKARRPLLLVFILSLLPLSACSYREYTDIAFPRDVRVRANVIQDGTDAVQCVLYAEGPFGDALSGAAATVNDPDNRMALLVYDASSCSYLAQLPAPSQETIYTFEVTSIILDEPLTIQVPYTPVETAPAVSVFQDSAGNDFFNAGKVAHTSPIQIGWESCGEDLTYQIDIKTTVKTVYSASTKALTVTIPADTLSGGVNYILQITAQALRGDPFYKTANYYSLSSKTSAGVYFDAE